MDNNKKGVLLVILASFINALYPIFAKLSHYKTNLLSILILKSIGVSIIAFTFLLITKTSFKIEKKVIPKLFYIVLIAIVFAGSLFIYALEKTPVLNAAVILELYPLAVIFLGFFLIGKKENLTKKQYFYVGIITIAALFVTTKTLDNLFNIKLGVIGDLLILLSVIGWASSDLVVKKHLKKINATLIVFYTYLISIIIFLALFLLNLSSFQFGVYPLVMGIFHGMQVILFYKALKLIKVSKAANLGRLTPVFSIILALLIFNEVITILQFIGILVIFIGVYLLAKKERKE